MKTIRIVTRTSDLAMWQARFIEQAIYAHHPHTKIELIGVKTQGDKILDVSLSKVGGKGLFVKELEDHLLSHSADLAVHSLKDVPYDLPPGLILAAFGEREDPRDVLISQQYNSIALLPKDARVGTSSLRRQAQLLKIRPDLKAELLRGNVPTRIQKCLEGSQYEAIILAAAGVKRLGLGAHIREYLPLDTFLPAVGQGVLALECHQDNHALLKLLAPLNHDITAFTSLAERSLNQALKGGCQVPIAGYATLKLLGSNISNSSNPSNPSNPSNHSNPSFLLTLQGRVLSPDGKICLEAMGELHGEFNLPLESFEKQKNALIQLGQSVAQKLIDQGADKIIAACYTQEKS
jgi:hydroxymethylbilane synthase